MRRVWLSFLLLSLSTATIGEDNWQGYSASDYFDPQTLSWHRIHKVTSRIYSQPIENIPEEERWSCVATEYSYNRDGNLVQVWLLRVGTPWVYYYSDGRVSDAGFGGDDGERMSEHEDPQKFRKYLEDVNGWILTKQADFNSIHQRYFSDTCYNLDGLYRVEHSPAANGLPQFAIAYLLKKGEQLRTPQRLYIYYDYSYYQDPPP